MKTKDQGADAAAVVTAEQSSEKSAIARHTPTPWHVGPYYKFDIESRVGRVAECRQFTPQGITDAEFIVRACNSHDEMLNALKNALAYAEAEAGPDIEFIKLDSGPMLHIDKLRAAIAKAEGRS